MIIDSGKQFGTRWILCSAIAIAVECEPLMANDSHSTIEEVVVTALKKAEGTSVLDTPLSVSAITGTELEDYGFTSVMDAISINPGVSTAKIGSQGESIQIRGVSGSLGDSPIGYYLDELPYTRVGQNVSPDLNPYDLNRVEVLRGPQGTLYGSGSAGGVVKIVTQDAVLNTLSGKATAGISNTERGDGNWKAQAAINIPLVDDVLALRLVGSYIDDSGYIDRPLEDIKNYNDSNDSAYRAKLLYVPDEELEIKLSVWQTKNEVYTPFSDSNFDAAPIIYNTDPATGSPDFTSFRPADHELSLATNETDLYGLVVNYEADYFQLLSSTSYMEGVSTQKYDVAVVAGQVLDFDMKTFGQEFRFSSSGSGPFSWTGGLIYLDMEMTRGQNFLLFIEDAPDPLGLEVDRATQTSEQWAGYGELQYQMSDTWSLSLGARYAADERQIVDKNPSVMLGLDSLGLDISRSENFNKTTGRFNLAWTPTENSLYFLNIAQGFRAGAPNSGRSLIKATQLDTNIPTIAEPDEVVSYEIGAKLSLLESGLSFEAVLYHLTWDDIQTFVSTVDSSNGGLVSWNDNASSSEGSGIDLALHYRGIDGLLLSISGNYSNSEYQDNVPSAGIAAGDTVFLAPDKTLSASGTYRWPLGSYEGVAFFSATYTDERSDYAPGFAYTSDAVTMLNARVGVENDNWSAYLTGENIGNEDGEVSSLAAFALVGANPVRYRPRTIGVELTYRFD
ncbi:TonB-dependent receptor [Parahaliea mediterranea]|uniref:TonB-dependent receptor n=1 Tax=Parahaliea mediterranea TaxID=651086 RepID=A0A939DFM3_9GAMM|nr:TonB-dependent receptor [Parahaliea mediterranea]MBN7797390.1 TonB-dependent receptor [Parahaliea mediterranea]